MSRDEFEARVESAFGHPEDARERTRIEALAAADPDLRARWDDLQPALEGLAGAGLEPLPPGLHARLIETAREAARGTGRVGSRGVSWLSFVQAALQTRPVFALGGAVAAGIAIGVFGFGLLARPLSLPLPLRGASTSASLPPVADEPATAAIELGEGEVTLTARRGLSDEVIVRLESRAEAPATVTLSWDPAAIRWSGARWETPDAPAFEAGTGRLRIDATTASEWVFTRLRPDADALRATLSGRRGEKEERLRLPR